MQTPQSQQIRPAAGNLLALLILVTSLSLSTAARGGTRAVRRVLCWRALSGWRRDRPAHTRRNGPPGGRLSRQNGIGIRYNADPAAPRGIAP